VKFIIGFLCLFAKRSTIPDTATPQVRAQYLYVANIFIVWLFDVTCPNIGKEKN
jgi:hypothetical protein